MKELQEILIEEIKRVIAEKGGLNSIEYLNALTRLLGVVSDYLIATKG